MRGDLKRWTYPALAVSVLANLFLAGIVIGHLAARPAVTAAKRGAQGPMVAVKRVRTLPVGERVAFTLAMRQHQPGIRGARQRLRSARREAEAAIVAPAYDGVQVAQRLAAVRDASAAQQTAVHGALVEALAKLSPASRAALVHPSAAVGDAAAAR